MNRVLLLGIVIGTAMTIGITAFSLGSGANSEAVNPGKLGDMAAPIQISDWINSDPLEVTPGQSGKAYLIEFWATWCPNCVASVPTLSKVQQQYGDEGLIVIAITDEEEDVVKAFVKEQGTKLKYAIAIDQDLVAARAYMGRFGLNGIPAAFLIDKQGKIVWVGHPSDPRLKTQLSTLFPSEATESAVGVKSNQTPTPSREDGGLRSNESGRSIGSGSKTK